MHRFRKNGIFCFLAVILTIAPASSTVFAEPSAVLPQSGWQFEPVPEGEKIFHQIPVRNSGVEPMKILDIRTG